MNRYVVNKTSNFFHMNGRILGYDEEVILGYTNSFIEFELRGCEISFNFRTGMNEEVNEPGIRVYVDGKVAGEIVLKKQSERILVYKNDSKAKEERPEDSSVSESHRIRLVKITEAAMSFVGISAAEVDGELQDISKKIDDRPKIEFIGDSITCGYGVLGEPYSEYTVREEDGEKSYANVLAQNYNLNARWVSVSGYGMFVEYTGDPENIVPKVYPYVNWFYDKETREDYSEFEPDIIIVNLGTNDSGHLKDENILNGFKSKYENFLYTLRIAHKNAAIVCVLGTLAPGVFKYVEEVINKVKSQGFQKLYGLELPEIDKENDGLASEHPTYKTHIKDANLIGAFLETEGLVDAGRRNKGEGGNG
ncbi:MAG: hypothetical protein K6E27_03530 [Eubacterium sp.]|nr:hypothetical protein [Eubacterium sp.]